MKRTALLVPLALVALSAAHGDARAAESYDSCAGFIDSVPATISTQGVWCLNADVATAISSGNAITIATNNVTIDCNGFKLGGLAAGPTSNASGIQANNRLNATVRNCNIRGFRRGVYLQGLDGSGHLVEDNRFDGNLYAGIVIEQGSNLVQRNRVYDTGADLSGAVGIRAFADITDNIVDGVTATVNAEGIVIGGPGTMARGNQVRNIVSAGGSSVGINILESHVAAVGNLVVNSPETAGRAIWGNGVGASFCGDNLVAGYTTGGISFCSDAGGNVEH